MSKRHAGRLLKLSKPRASGRNEVLRQRLRELAEKRPRFGYRRLQALLQREGWKVYHKRIHRLYRQARLSLRRRRRKRWMRGGVRHSAAPKRANERWSMDLVSDRVASGQTVRVFNVVDAQTRESLAMEVDTSLASERVVRALEAVICNSRNLTLQILMSDRVETVRPSRHITITPPTRRNTSHLPAHCHEPAWVGPDDDRRCFTEAAFWVE
jgi:hypothetical protein